MTELPAGARPELPEVKGESVEYTSKDLSARWKFTNMDANEWMVQMAGSDTYVGRLERDRHGGFDYRFQGMGPGPTTNGDLIGATWHELFSMHFG